MKKEVPLHKKAYDLKDQTKDTLSQKTLSLVSRGKITQTIVQVKIAPENVTLNFIKHISRDDQIVSFRLHSCRSCSRDVTELIL